MIDPQIDCRRRSRRRREARRRQIRRRRAIALSGVFAFLLFVTFLVAAQVPAEPTATSEGQPDAPSTEAGSVDCSQGQAEGEADAEAQAEAQPDCEPPAEESAEEPAEAPGGGEDENAEQPEVGGEGTEGEPGQVEAAADGQADKPVEPGSGHPAGVVAGSSIRPARSHGKVASPSPHGGGSHRSSPSGKSGDHRRAKARTGGTTVPDGSAGTGNPVPANWDWSGPWAIPWPIVACESGGDYGALNPSSGAGGAYQIIPSTWQAYGGKGAPQASPPSEQDRIAAQIWADSGPAAWACAQGGGWLGAGLSGAFGALPDPLPPARRLDPAFVSALTRVARAERVDWALLLALVRLRGGRGQVPASVAELRRLAAQVADLNTAPARAQARRLFERRAQTRRVLALTYYNRAVGRRGLVEGLTAVAGRLAERVLKSNRLLIYPGGRADVEAGRVDVRVLTVLLYLAERYRSVTVTSLMTGHSFFTTAGRPSLHAFGRAVDIAALNGTPILGHQQPGGLTERALRRILLLPRELQPSELISLFDLGGPSFAASDHADHIHVGF